jgi:hypothetical protein
MEVKQSLAWPTKLTERLIELSKEDPEAYKQWHNWHEPRAKSPPFLRSHSAESLGKLKEVLDVTIKERRWACVSLKEGSNRAWAACVARRDNIRHYGAGESAPDALLDAYLSAIKGCRGSTICLWMP